MSFSVRTAVAACLTSLEEIEANARQGPQPVSASAWKDELGRLRLWAAGIGAFGTGQDSIASNLGQCSSHVHSHLQSLLQDLNGVLKRVRPDVTSGPTEESDISTNDSEDSPHKPRIYYLHEELQTIIGCLNRLSMVIPDPEPSDATGIVPDLATTSLEDTFYDDTDESVLDRETPASSQWALSPADTVHTDTFNLSQPWTPSPAASSGTNDTTRSGPWTGSPFAERDIAEPTADTRTSDSILQTFMQIRPGHEPQFRVPRPPQPPTSRGQMAFEQSAKRSSQNAYSPASVGSDAATRVEPLFNPSVGLSTHSSSYTAWGTEHVVYPPYGGEPYPASSAAIETVRKADSPAPESYNRAFTLAPPSLSRQFGTSFLGHEETPPRKRRNLSQEIMDSERADDSMHGLEYDSAYGSRETTQRMSEGPGGPPDSEAPRFSKPESKRR